MNQIFENISLNAIRFSSGNPRKKINDKSLKELAASIKANGVMNPIVVKRLEAQLDSGAAFELIAGERRTRAAMMVGLVTIPAIIRAGDSEAKVLELQITENLQRENVGYFEEAEAMQRLREMCDLDMSEIAQKIGKSVAYVSFQLQLCGMPEEVKEAMRNGWVTKGVAWEIARLPMREYQITAATGLARKQREKMISLSRAKFFIGETFGNKKREKKTSEINQNVSEYELNWKKYLVNFTNEQFESFRRIVRGKTETAKIAEAVDLVMRRS